MEINALENLANQATYNSEKFTHKLLLQNENQKSILFGFSEGQELKTHTTPTPALLIMLEGTSIFEMNGASKTLSAGEVIEIPAQVPHSLKAASNFKMILVK
jgi:quercetin dioxygenase-like cupin family protein